MGDRDQLGTAEPSERRHDYGDFIDAIQAITLRMAEVTERIAELDKRLSSDQHKCRFDEDEARAMHRFGQSMSNGGWDKFQAVLEFGQTLINVRKAGTTAMVVAMVGAILGMLWIGFVGKIKGAQ